MRVVIAAFGSPFQVYPTIWRLLKTVPIGQPPPILLAILCKPRGVIFEPAFSPIPNLEVEQRIVLRKRKDAEANRGVPPSWGRPPACRFHEPLAQLMSLEMADRIVCLTYSPTACLRMLTTRMKRDGTTRSWRARQRQSARPDLNPMVNLTVNGLNGIWFLTFAVSSSPVFSPAPWNSYHSVHIFHVLRAADRRAILR